MHKPRVVLITGHYWNSKRKAGFHWLADAFHNLDWEVLFFTASLSWLSYLRRDHRLRYFEFWGERNVLCKVKPGFFSYVWFTPFHPANLRFALLNRLSKRLFASYGELPLGEVEEWITSADIFVFESTPGLMLFHKFKSLNPQAKFIYRASDDLRLLKNHPVVVELENAILSEFDVVSVPSQYMYENFKDRAQNLYLHYHGIQKELFDRSYLSPFDKAKSPNFVFVGISRLDYDFLQRAAHLLLEAQFHIVGPFEPKIRNSNIHFYGEQPFINTIPFIKCADVGLATWEYSPGAESFSDTLKIIQYSYVRLPIIAPDFLCSSRPNVISYRPGDDASIAEALRKALEMDRSTIPTSDIYSWEELVQALLEG
ncbi:glucuronosyltransferase [Meiothermus cerbereus]|uniref:GumK N-terminal domain-containing glycosyltransferase n=1 Tax=Meiothermus cerbereus TaxID=65552 RepID=UPI000566E30C|nr:glucuronosyltransferase [Meiothermus cerbereus]